MWFIFPLIVTTLSTPFNVIKKNIVILSYKITPEIRETRRRVRISLRENSVYILARNFSTKFWHPNHRFSKNIFTTLRLKFEISAHEQIVITCKYILFAKFQTWQEVENVIGNIRWWTKLPIFIIKGNPNERSCNFMPCLEFHK